jgi:hypothetical protein
LLIGEMPATELLCGGDFIGAPFSLPERASGCFPPGAARGIVAAMDDNSRQQIRNSPIADLASARAGLVAIQADAGEYWAIIQKAKDLFLEATMKETICIAD